MPDNNMYNIDGEQLVRMNTQGLRVSVENIPCEVKDRIVWAALGVEIAYGNGDLFGNCPWVARTKFVRGYFYEIFAFDEPSAVFVEVPSGRSH